jgi:hypothetical protein
MWLQEHKPKRGQKRHMLKRHWIMYSKYDSHSRFNVQHIWGRGRGRGRGAQYDHLMSTRIFTMILIFKRAPKSRGK